MVLGILVLGVARLRMRSLDSVSHNLLGIECLNLWRRRGGGPEHDKDTTKRWSRLSGSCATLHVSGQDTCMLGLHLHSNSTPYGRIHI